MKYKLIYEYRARVPVEVEADSEEEAQEKGLSDADDYLQGYLSVYGIEVKEIKE